MTPSKRSRLFQRYTQGSSPPNESDREAPTIELRQVLSISPRSTRTTDSGTRTKARGKGKIPKPVLISDGSEDTSSEEVVDTPARKRKAVAQIRESPLQTNHQAEDESSDDLQGELEDLRGTGTPLRSNRTRDGPILSERGKRQQKLEELKRRRAGIIEESGEEDEQDDEDGIEGNDEPDLSELEPTHHAVRRGGDLDEYEEDFVDDEDDKVGIDLGVAGVPLEFTYHANKKPFEHFKTEIEWMVHNKLNPAFDRYDDIYRLAHQKLDKEVEGFVGSKFSSSVWGEAFQKALHTLPDLDRIDVPTMLEQKCDACRRTGHPTKNKVTFSGKPYNRDTLEIVEDEEDEDDIEDSDDDESSSTKEGESFFLGRFDILYRDFTSHRD